MSDMRRDNPVIRFLAVPFLFLMGGLFLLAALSASWRAWIGVQLGDLNFIYLGMAFLFFYMAILVAEKNVLRKRFMDLLDEIQKVYYGSSYGRLQDAVEILLRAIRKGEKGTASVAAAELKRLTGQDFGTDYARWDTWWAENRVHFLMARRTVSDAEGKDSHAASE